MTTLKVTQKLDKLEGNLLSLLLLHFFQEATWPHAMTIVIGSVRHQHRARKSARDASQIFANSLRIEDI